MIPKKISFNFTSKLLSRCIIVRDEGPELQGVSAGQVHNKYAYFNYLCYVHGGSVERRNKGPCLC